MRQNILDVWYRVSGKTKQNKTQKNLVSFFSFFFLIWFALLLLTFQFSLSGDQEKNGVIDVQGTDSF